MQIISRSIDNRESKIQFLGNFYDDDYDDEYDYDDNYIDHLYGSQKDYSPSNNKKVRVKMFQV